MRVDVPDPLLPTIARLSPFSMLSETPLSASKRFTPLPYDLVRFRVSSTGDVMTLLGG